MKTVTDFESEDYDEKFEREWRELLIKRLMTVQSVLKRDATAERKKIAKARELSAGYETAEEAHEAYGWDVITWEQYERIQKILEQDPNVGNVPNAALNKISDIIQGLKDDIVQPESLRKFDAKIKDYFVNKDTLLQERDNREGDANIMNGSKKEGTLTMTCEDNDGYRLDIRYPDGSYHGGLHCGDTLEVLCDGVWRTTSVESGLNDDGEDDWYLTGLYKPGDIPTGLTARRNNK